jgi:hypothetical protein
LDPFWTSFDTFISPALEPDFSERLLLTPTHEILPVPSEIMAVGISRAMTMSPPIYVKLQRFECELQDSKCKLQRNLNKPAFFKEPGQGGGGDGPPGRGGVFGL